FGTNAAKIAVGMGAVVTILDKDLARLTYLDDIFGGRLITVYSDVATIEENVLQSDLVVGAVLITGAKAPKLVSEELVSRMTAGSVVVDVSVDQGGCIETCKPTTHDNPTYVKHGVIHYCVANMPGAVARTSTFALTNVTISYARKLADLGFSGAVKADAAIAKGVNTFKGKMTHAAVADSLGYKYQPLESLL
ncbi:MAG: alanine dehydrogenase, partial [Deltaproteobacteria bacterium]|nr:alanine dehydrogenase [Deltaproteobacteria bacterium]